MSLTLSKPNIASNAATHAHLLDAAGEVFAEVGFKAATVRQICERAHANIAAVNYHFGDKETLYKAVLKSSHRAAMEEFPPTMGLKAGSDGEKRLRAFIHSFLMRIFSTGPGSRYSKLMTREMIEPTGALESVVKETIRPMSNELESILRGLMGTRTDKATLRLFAMSVVSQILFYHHCRPSITLLYPEMDFDASSLKKLSEHITRFSIAAIADYCGKK
jgi:AcrR family transcriptional regulator